MKVLVQKLVVSWKVFLKIEMVLLAHSIFLMNRILAYEFLKTFLRVIFSYIYSKMEFDENILVFLICLIVTACFHWSRCVFEITLQKQSLDQNSNHKGEPSNTILELSSSLKTMGCAGCRAVWGGPPGEHMVQASFEGCVWSSRLQPAVPEKTS